MPITNHLGHKVLSPITDKEEFEKACKKNIYHMLMYSALQGICQAIAQMGIFDAYLYVMAGDSNKAVGWAESISGLSQVSVAIPAGILVDKFSRALICRWCGWFSLLMVVLSICGIYYDNMIVICFALAVAGGYFATQNCATYSLFADSIPQGHRAKWLTRASVVNQLASGLGPFIGLFLFVYFGNEWRLSVLHTVLIIGFLGFIPANFFLFGWTDVTHEDGLGGNAGRSGAHVYRKTTSEWTWTIPYLMCANDFITCIGAGMTVKFFPLFFKNDYNFSPTQVQLLWAFYGLTFGLFTWFCDKVANHVGRVQAGILFSTLGVICLFCLAWVRWLPAVVFTFLLRGAVQNAIYPVDRSIIMDFVPSHQRGRWNALESLSSMTWSGSAVIGGYLMDNHDYRYTFVVTAYIYLVALLMRLPLLKLVPKEEKFTFTESLLSVPESNASMDEERMKVMASPRTPNSKFEN
ncbi:conserved hypothetical protein [Perkinsus marinus ATCC 50983]|uniref:Major facilitator superfamily (MFS) profile domain-containing protein n=1 Tax=Perkinsus marinus (strain ATCC 50983 / TXsc) TaxID=423536 RepID=C5KE45_PERM5|nr:conserved hypothetical protein [Perkinsus marinus ATCC 50983]EER17257.1 conserved hypothetical protein [Perkinsus marinus ATCC 50983]|eukprot:XP_002785461.1 conserved hypothetical protein [Perkinsus marinus ATCC 50983]